ncbi:hypothetical protein FQR65_LT08946 [Abscondita terminalis]|nr:hypothetical protein FQR65_LT08946 [Abscondita terminalis]
METQQPQIKKKQNGDGEELEKVYEDSDKENDFFSSLPRRSTNYLSHLASSIHTYSPTSTPISSPSTSKYTLPLNESSTSCNGEKPHITEDFFANLCKGSNYLSESFIYAPTSPTNPPSTSTNTPITPKCTRPLLNESFTSEGSQLPLVTSSPSTSKYTPPPNESFTSSNGEKPHITEDFFANLCKGSNYLSESPIYAPTSPTNPPSTSTNTPITPKCTRPLLNESFTSEGSQLPLVTSSPSTSKYTPPPNESFTSSNEEKPHITEDFFANLCKGSNYLSESPIYAPTSPTNPPSTSTNTPITPKCTRPLLNKSFTSEGSQLSDGSYGSWGSPDYDDSSMDDSESASFVYYSSESSEFD